MVLDNTAVVSQHQNICPVKNKFETLSNPLKCTEAADKDILKLYLKAEDIATETFEYKTPEIYEDERVKNFMSQLSVEDMVKIVPKTLCV